MRAGLAAAALRSLAPRGVGAARALSAKPPAPPTPAELEKMYQTSEQTVKKIKEGTYLTVQPPMVRDVPDADTYVPAEMSEMAVLTDQPMEQKNRTVYIQQKPQTAMQSAPSKSYAWTISWPQQSRWSNPLMGWTSTADPMSNQTMYFDSAEAAMRFCERQGWKYEVYEPINRKWELGTKKYSFNFLAENVERKLRKEGPRTKEFVQPTGLASNWFMPLTFHGEGEVVQHGPPAPPAKSAIADKLVKITKDEEKRRAAFEKAAKAQDKK